MTTTPEAHAAYVDAAAAALELPLHPDHRPGVLRWFAVAAELAERLAAEPLGRDDDPAGVFVPIEPPRSQGVAS